MIVKREHIIGDIKKFAEKLLLEEGVKHQRFFKKGRSLIIAMKMTEFRAFIEFDKPLLYIPPMPLHDAQFVLQSERIVVKAENETEANELVDVFISKHKL